MNMNDGSQSNQFFKAYYKSKPRGKRGVYLLILIALIIIFGAIGVYWLGRAGMSKPAEYAGENKMRAVTASVLPTSSVSAVLNVPTGQEDAVREKIAQIDRGSIDLIVLNGSGVQGAATTTALYLKKLGYNVIKTENADSFDYEGVRVFVKKSSGQTALLLKKDLDEFQKNEIQGNLRASVSAGISDNITYDAEVIIGK